jgi:type I restriction enzyme M protein
LIDATGWYKPLRKNLGKKNCELSRDDIQKICDTFLAFEESEQSKIFPSQAFGYWKVTVERPRRLCVDLGEAARGAFRQACRANKETPLAELVDALAGSLGPGPHLDYNAFLAALERQAQYQDIKLPSKRLKLVQTELAKKDESARPVIKKIHKPGKAEADPLYGLFPVEQDGRPALVEYEPNPDLRDTEQIPLLEEGGIEAFIRREVLPYVPDAWIDPESTRTGYEISFTRYFYKPQPLRSLEEIRAEIEALERETDGLLDQILFKDTDQ